ncbi:b486fcbd-0cf8-4703-a7c7-cdff6c36a9fd [Thermothielavioides terrestris]|uniref:B486fcbd-0cf8-4703-a7c7-cdff6c36a9fd n=1 Tax=Thermothielavioides terrestris TaxID=2587410 RepID=A0A446B5I1_9PEZI|nr:b486fcbd-0cf8-4703-a7c7-cdff6c36a9fd [Thermothielavioides terrestris]
MDFFAGLSSVGLHPADGDDAAASLSRLPSWVGRQPNGFPLCGRAGSTPPVEIKLEPPCTPCRLPGASPCAHCASLDERRAPASTKLGSYPGTDELSPYIKKEPLSSSPLPGRTSSPAGPRTPVSTGQGVVAKWSKSSPEIKNEPPSSSPLFGRHCMPSAPHPPADARPLSRCQTRTDATAATATTVVTPITFHSTSAITSASSTAGTSTFPELGPAPAPAAVAPEAPACAEGVLCWFGFGIVFGSPAAAGERSSSPSLSRLSSGAGGACIAGAVVVVVVVCEQLEELLESSDARVRREEGELAEWAAMDEVLPSTGVDEEEVEVYVEEEEVRVKEEEGEEETWS